MSMGIYEKLTAKLPSVTDSRRIAQKPRALLSLSHAHSPILGNCKPLSACNVHIHLSKKTHLTLLKT